MPTSKKVRSKEDVSYWTPHIQKDFEDGQGFPSKYYVASGWSDADGYHVLASGDAFKGINDPNKLLKQLLRNFSSGFGPYVEDDPWMGHQEFPIHNEMIIIEKQVCRHLNKTARRILFDPSIIEGKNLIHPVVWIEGPPLEKEDEDQAAASSSSSAAAATSSGAAADDTFSIHVKTLTGGTHSFNVTPHTTLKEVFNMVQTKTNIHPMQMLFVVKNKSLPRIEDDGVERPLSDFNMFQETTIHLILRLSPSSPAPYRREVWFPSATGR